MENYYKDTTEVWIDDRGRIFLTNNDEDFDFTQQLIEDIEDHIWTYEEEVGKKSTDEEWFSHREERLKHFCISNEIECLTIGGEEIEL